MKKKLLSLWVSLRALMRFILEGIGLTENVSGMSIKELLKMLLFRLMIYPFGVIAFIFATIVVMIVTIVFYAVSLFRMPSLSRDLWKMIRLYIAVKSKSLLTKLFQRKRTS